jgi:hypothetical protein
MGDAADALDGGCLHDNQACARHGKVHPVLEMPVGRGAVIGRVLAHGRHRDAVGQRDRSEFERREKAGGAVKACAWPFF